MKKFNLRLAIGLMAVMTIGVFNFKYAYEGYGNAVNKVVGTNGGTGTTSWGGTGGTDGGTIDWDSNTPGRKEYSVQIDCPEILAGTQLTQQKEYIETTIKVNYEFDYNDRMYPAGVAIKSDTIRIPATYQEETRPASSGVEYTCKWENGGKDLMCLARTEC